VIVIMRPGAPRADAERVLDALERRAVRASVFFGAERVVITVSSEPPVAGLAELVERLPGVERVAPLRAAYHLVSREFRGHDTLVDVAGVGVGGAGFVVLAGPCIVESRDQLAAAARAAAGAGAAIMRGDAYRSDRSPYALQGLGEEGLGLLADVRRELGLPVAAEAPESAVVEAVAAVVDLLEIGPDNMHNRALLRAAAATGRPVLLKRGLNATVDEWLTAAEHVVHAGNPRVILCERGIRTFEPDRPSTLDLSAVAVAKRLSHLPVIVDPSHGTGRADLVRPMALAAAAAGADGLLVEVHAGRSAEPGDAPQSLPVDAFTRLMDELRGLLAALGRPLVRPRGAPAR
jgi:3-deoxy-7-phosphoheptulonate synthase